MTEAPWIVGVKGENPAPKPARRRRWPKLGGFRPDWREIGSNLAELTGIGAISAGAWLITPSAGLISGGVGLVLVGVATSVQRTKGGQ